MYHVQLQLDEELEKLRNLEPSSSEFNVTRNYLDWSALSSVGRLRRSIERFLLWEYSHRRPFELGWTASAPRAVSVLCCRASVRSGGRATACVSTGRDRRVCVAG